MSAGDPIAARLEGLTIDGDWTVERRLNPGPKATGSMFSIGYVACHPKRGTAFLKALDFSRALADPDLMRTLQVLTEGFNYECRILDKCGEAKMDRVVRALDTGILRVDGEILPVPWVLFEHADGDVRAHLDATVAFDHAWALRSLHHVAVGLFQLHRQSIAHQDLKPSNVLVFDGNSSKIADLGRADYRGHDAPHSRLPYAGDPNYAPPELLYGDVAVDWETRRQSCDLYHLGSLILFLFTGASTTPAIVAKLDASHKPYAGSGYAAVLPYVRAAFNEVAEEFANELPDGLEDLVTIFRELCDPEPGLRGHPKARTGPGNPYSLERYVSRLNLLASRAEGGLRSGVGR